MGTKTKDKTNSSKTAPVVLSTIKDRDAVSAAEAALRKHKAGKKSNSKGGKLVRQADKDMAAALVILETTAVEIADPDAEGATWDAYWEPTKSDPKATAWDAYIASLSPEDAKKATAKFYTPNVTRGRKLRIKLRK